MGKTLKQIDLDFDYSIFLKDKHTDEWSVLPYYKRIESEPLPDTYIENNTQINQIFWSKDEVDFYKISLIFIFHLVLRYFHAVQGTFLN